jgi:integrase
MTIRSGVLTDDMIQKLVSDYRIKALVPDHTFPPVGKDFRLLYTEHLENQRDICQESLLDARGQDANNTDLALYILRKAGMVPPDCEDIPPDTPGFNELCIEAARAQLEIVKTIHQRTTTGDSEYDKAERSKPKSKTLKELIELYWKEKASEWSDPDSTKGIHRKILHIMGDIPLNEIDRARCVQFREELKAYPLKNSDFTTPWRVLSAKSEKRMGERTQNGTIIELITLFKYAANADYGIKGNPASKLSKSKEDCAPVKVREFYTTDELNRMILALTKVNRVKKPETFWIPLMLLYTGARSNEICMLRCADIADGIIHFYNRPRYNQRTKNEKDRVAPIHADLLRIGLMEFVERQKAAGRDRLFPALTLCRGKWNVGYGKQYNRTFKLKFLEGYTPEELTAKDLHSFRKTFITWFTNARVLKTIDDIATLRRIVGHFDSDDLRSANEFLQKAALTLDGYGGGLNSDEVAFMAQLDYGIDLTPILM